MHSCSDHFENRSRGVHRPAELVPQEFQELTGRFNTEWYGPLRVIDLADKIEYLQLASTGFGAG